MKTIATFLLLAAATSYCTSATADTAPTPSKAEAKAAKKKAGKMFGKRPPESAYAKAMRRNELFR